jgi:arylsulfatase
VELRFPLIFNLRCDPFGKAQHNSNTNWDWVIDRVFVIAPIQGLAAKFLLSMKEFPPSQSPGSFNLSKVEATLKSALSR